MTEMANAVTNAGLRPTCGILGVTFELWDLAEARFGPKSQGT